MENGTYFYYILNLQGDVIRLVNSSGAIKARYEYDPYGKVISATGSMASINPLRYRGYYYDQESGMYFLQSRYYDPAICRFINADSFASTGQGILGHNMFAYCGNNPVMRIDPTGKNFVDWIKSAWNAITDFAMDVLEYMGNVSEATARSNLEDSGFTFYRGSLVFSADFLETSAFSFGVIVIGTDNLQRADFNDTLNHEYGHFIHFSMLGPIEYFRTTAIPSLIFAGLSNEGIFPNEYYYDLPWERTADRLGGVERNYLPTTNFAASVFWLHTLWIAHFAS